MTNSIKFYWNGLRLNGEKTLVKCFYSLDNHVGLDECVTIYAKGWSDLPGDLFPVENDSDSYTDYFEHDRATLTPDHPLYKYARYAAVKAQIRDLKSSIKHDAEYMEKKPYFAAKYDYAGQIEEKKERLAKLEALEDPGQPTAEDLARIDQMRQEAENARVAAEKEAEQKAREEMLAQKSSGRIFIEDVARKHPIQEGEPVVTIEWSENPAFYSWKDGELKLSVAAAEIILKQFDEKVHAEGERGYDKTSFRIDYVNEDGEQDTYEGRYDLGDNDGGMIEHIRSFGRHYMEKGQFSQGPSEEDKETGAAIMRFADMLAGYAEKTFFEVTFVHWIGLNKLRSSVAEVKAFEIPAPEAVETDDTATFRVYFEDKGEAEGYRQRLMANLQSVPMH